MQGCCFQPLVSRLLLVFRVVMHCVFRLSLRLFALSGLRRLSTRFSRCFPPEALGRLVGFVCFNRPTTPTSQLHCTYNTTSTNHNPEGGKRHRMGLCPSRARSTTTTATTRSRLELRRIFRRAVTRVVRLLLIRKRWAGVGIALQQVEVQQIFEGLERVKGVLTRPRRGHRITQ